MGMRPVILMGMASLTADFINKNRKARYKNGGLYNIWPTVSVVLSQFHVQLMPALADNSGAALMQTTTLRNGGRILWMNFG